MVTSPKFESWYEGRASSKLYDSYYGLQYDECRTQASDLPRTYFAICWNAWLMPSITITSARPKFRSLEKPTCGQMTSPVLRGPMKRWDIMHQLCNVQHRKLRHWWSVWSRYDYLFNGNRLETHRWLYPSGRCSLLYSCNLRPLKYSPVTNELLSTNANRLSHPVDS